MREGRKKERTEGHSKLRIYHEVLNCPKLSTITHMQGKKYGNIWNIQYYQIRSLGRKRGNKRVFRS